MAPDRARSRVLQTAFGRYLVAWVPLATSPLPGFRACAVQAVPAEPHPTRAIRLVLYERIVPPPADSGAASAA